MKNQARSEAAWDLLHAHDCLCEAHRKLEDKDGNLKDRSVGERFIEAFNAIDDLLARFGHPLAISLEQLGKVARKSGPSRR